MSTSPEFLQYILDMLAPVGYVQTSRMFSGVLLKVERKQLGVMLGEVLYFKVIDAELQEQYKKKGSVQFSYTRKDKKDPVIIKNWWSVPESAMDNEEEIVTLAREVLAQEEL